MQILGRSYYSYKGNVLKVAASNSSDRDAAHSVKWNLLLSHTGNGLSGVSQLEVLLIEEFTGV